MNNVILNEWIPMEPEQTIPDSVKMISVDTRDFHWFLSEEMPKEKVPDYPVCWPTIDPKHIYSLVNELQVRCKDKKWNFLETKGGGYWDLKYIWFKRENDGQFSVWTRNWGETLDISRGLTALVNWERNEQ